MVSDFKGGLTFGHRVDIVAVEGRPAGEAKPALRGIVVGREVEGNKVKLGIVNDILSCEIKIVLEIVCPEAQGE